MLFRSAGIPPDKLLRANVETMAPDALANVPLDDVAVVLWLAPLPEAGSAAAVGRFVDRAGIGRNG